VRRFLLLVLTPALVTCIGVIQMAQDARHTRRNDRLERVSGVLVEALREDLVAAWGFLELEAGPLVEADTTIGAVRTALQGDTVRALSGGNGGPVAAVMFLQRDTLRSASATFQSPLLGRVAMVTPLDIGLYLQGFRVLPPPPAPGVQGMPDSLATAAGWSEEASLWVTPVSTTALGQEGNRVALAARYSTPERSVASVRTLAAATVLLLLALLSAWMGLTGRSRSSAPGAVALAVVLLTGMTLIVSVWVALGESRIASAEGVRELSTLATLVRERGLMTAPGAAEDWIGTTVIRVSGDDLVTADGAPPPAFVRDLPIPPPSFPASGRTPDGQIYLVIAGGGAPGRTVFLTDPTPAPPLILFSLLGTLLTALGSISVARRAAHGARPHELGLSG